ncbi:beta-1,3-glucosyltransferase-like, partial [Micropterus salmoides]|uniref:beta-1,3-glucosyltransferase-like n=1 Tax=Micropterus salmoides TaxID=27706 RepID=UPI0018EA65B2
HINFSADSSGKGSQSQDDIHVIHNNQLDLREIVFVLQSQSNSFHVGQAERRRADLLKQAHSLTEVRFKAHLSLLHTFWYMRSTYLLGEICVGQNHH